MGNTTSLNRTLLDSIKIALNDYKQEESESSVYVRISGIYNRRKTDKDKNFTSFPVKRVTKEYYIQRCWNLFNQIKKDNPYGFWFTLYVTRLGD